MKLKDLMTPGFKLPKAESTGLKLRDLMKPAAKKP